MKNAIRHTAGLLAAACLLTACVKEEYRGPDPTLPRRTVLVWLAGGHDTAAECEATVEALRQGWTYTGNRCLVYCHPADAAPRLVSLRGGCSVTPEPYVELVAEYPDSAPADAETLVRILRDAAGRYPADSYGLVYAPHTAGWIAEDGTTSGASPEAELAALARALPDRALEFILFEQGFTAGVESLYALRRKAAWIMVSSAEMPAPGYRETFRTHGNLLFDTSLDPGEALARFGRACIARTQARTGAKIPITLSLVRTDRLDALAAQVAKKVAAASEETLTATDGIQCFDRVQYDRRGSLRHYDMGAWYRRSGDDAGEVDPAAAAVVWKAVSQVSLPDMQGFTIHEHSGLTTHIPAGEDPEADDAWRRTQWARTIGMDYEQ